MRTPLFIPYTLLSLLLLLSCQESAKKPSSAPPAEVPVIQVAKKSLTAYREYPAMLEGSVNSEVRAKVSGYITDVLIDEGQEVTKGQLLFTLETQSLSQDSKAAEAEVEAARVEVEKLSPLVKKGIISDVQLQTAKAKLAQAKSRLQGIQASIDYARIKSPVKGVIGTINYRQGALVSPSDPRPLTTVSAIENVYAVFSLNEKEYFSLLNNNPKGSAEDRLKNFPPLELKLADGSTYPQSGQIETISGTINRQSGTVNVRVKFPNPNRILTDGNSGTIRIPVNYDNALVVPEPSTYEQQGEVFVYTINENSEATPRKIEVLARTGGFVLIESGIKEGEVLIASGIAKIRNGAVVTPKPISMEEVNSFKPAFK